MNRENWPMEVTQDKTHACSTYMTQGSDPYVEITQEQSWSSNDEVFKIFVISWSALKVILGLLWPMTKQFLCHQMETLFCPHILGKNSKKSGFFLRKYTAKSGKDFL